MKKIIAVLLSVNTDKISRSIKAKSCVDVLIFDIKHANGKIYILESGLFSSSEFNGFHFAYGEKMDEVVVKEWAETYFPNSRPIYNKQILGWSGKHFTDEEGMPSFNKREYKLVSFDNEDATTYPELTFNGSVIPKNTQLGSGVDIRQIVSNKFLTRYVMQKAGLEDYCPKSILVDLSKKIDKYAIFEKMGNPSHVFVKTLTDSNGNGVFLCTIENLKEKLHELNVKNEEKPSFVFVEEAFIGDYVTYKENQHESTPRVVYGASYNKRTDTLIVNFIRGYNKLAPEPVSESLERETVVSSYTKTHKLATKLSEERQKQYNQELTQIITKFVRACYTYRVFNIIQMIEEEKNPVLKEYIKKIFYVNNTDSSFVIDNHLKVTNGQLNTLIKRASSFDLKSLGAQE